MYVFTNKYIFKYHVLSKFMRASPVHAISGNVPADHLTFSLCMQKAVIKRVPLENLKPWKIRTFLGWGEGQKILSQVYSYFFSLP